MSLFLQKRFAYTVQSVLINNNLLVENFITIKLHFQSEFQSFQHSPDRIWYCFHGSGTVQTAAGPTKLSDWNGEPVLTWDSSTNKMVFSRVLYWMHRDANVEAPFLNIKLATGEQLDITGKHLIYRFVDCHRERPETVFAEQLAPKDCLMESSGSLAEIKQITIQTRTGIFAPVTETGTVIVSDVVASCFAETNHEIAQKLFFKMAVFLNTVAELLSGVSDGQTTFSTLFEALAVLQSYTIFY